MPANNHGSRFESEISGIKRELDVFIKSEFEPSLASLPMAPNMVDKKEPMEDSKTGFSNTSGGNASHRSRRRSGRRHYHGSGFIGHRVHGYHIRAHYGKGKVDFIITSQNLVSRDVDWMEVERDIFRKFHKARFDIVPTDSPGAFLQSFFSSGKQLFNRMQFSSRVHHRLSTPPNKHASGSDTEQTTAFKKEVVCKKEEEEDVKFCADSLSVWKAEEENHDLKLQVGTPPAVVLPEPGSDQKTTLGCA